MFMGGDWKQLYTPYWIKIILLFLTKCSIVHHVGLKKFLLVLNAQLYTMFDVRYPTTATCPNMGYALVGLAQAPQSYPIRPGEKVGHKAHNFMEE